MKDTDSVDDDLGPERLRLARERWQCAQADLFAVLPPQPEPLGATMSRTPPAAEVVHMLMTHAQGAYADYITELHRMHGG